MTNSLFLPDFLAEDSSHSEHEVFEALKSTLTPGWTVFSSVHWTSKNSRGKFRDGEADFVLYHPERALLVLEVKGGGIEFDPHSGDWYTVPAGQARRKLKRGPLTQARSNMYAILKLLRRHTKPNGLPQSWGYGVVLPNVVDLSGLVDKHPQAPSGLVACSHDLAYLGEWCVALARGWMKKGSDNFEDLGAAKGVFLSTDPEPVDSIVAFLRNALCPTVNLPTELCLRQGIEQEQQLFLELSKNQCRVLSPLQRNRRLAVSGGAGTGKTLLALNKAIIFARTGVPTLLTCYNRVLAESMLAAAKRALRASKDDWVLDGGFLLVQTLHDYVAEIMNGGADDHDVNDAEFWRKLPNNFAQWRMHNELPTKNLIQALVLDEGQDFGLDWWKIIPDLLAEPEDDYLWVFFDNNQAIYAEGLGEDVAEFLPGAAQVDLDENFRNTKEIHAIFQPYCQGLEQRALGPVGRKPEIVTVAEGQSTFEVVSKVVRRLIDEEGTAPESIAVLTPSRRSSELFVDELGGYSTQNSGDIQTGQVVIETIQSFKGQESPVVILAEMHLAAPDQADLLRYIAMSRAVHHLILVESR
jgi:nuclease-like protein/UvrD-like helicase family protein